jgi:CheY-like chemotaxis protein
MAATILVVEDTEAIRQLLAEALESDGYTVATARHGGEALELVDERRPDLILTDMHMPVVDGWTFIRAYRAQGGRAPIIIMAAAPEAQAWARELDVEGLLPKPFTLDYLSDLVARTIKVPSVGTTQSDTPFGHVSGPQCALV